MPYRKEIAKAIDALLLLQRSDGGIPATKSEDLSGSWTTADTLEAILISNTFSQYGLSRIKSLTNYLLYNQIDSNNIQNLEPRSSDNLKFGGWSTYQGTEPGTMTTGHCVASLILARNFLDDDCELQIRLKNAIKAGFEWLERSQNSDGSWGVLPNSSEDGKNSRVIAIHYALLPYFYCNHNVKSSKIMRDAVEYLKKTQNKDGSWSVDRMHSGDICNTARAISCIVKSDDTFIKSKMIKKALSYLVSNQIPNYGLWEIETERFDISNLPGSTVFNDNTNCDVMMAFIDSQYFSEETYQLFEWLLETQSDNGLWVLKSPTKSVNEINTWSTAEWVLCIDKFSRELIGHQMKLFLKPQSNWKLLFVGFIFGIFIIIAYYNIEGILLFWENLSDFFKFGVIFAIIIGLVTNFFYEWIKEKIELTKDYFIKSRKSKSRKKGNH